MNSHVRITILALPTFIVLRRCTISTKQPEGKDSRSRYFTTACRPRFFQLMTFRDIGNHITIDGSDCNKMLTRQQQKAPLLPQRSIQLHQVQARRGFGRAERVWSVSISRQNVLYVLMFLLSNNLWITFEVIFFAGSLSLSLNTLKTVQHDIDDIRKAREKLRIKLRNLDWETAVATSDLKIATERQRLSVRAASRTTDASI